MMNPKNWLKKNLKHKEITVDDLPEAIHYFERAITKASFAKKVDAIKKLGLSSKVTLERQGDLKKELEIALKRLRPIGRATLFRFMKGTIIKESTLSRMELFFDDKFFRNEVNIAKSALEYHGKDACMTCDFANIGACSDNWLGNKIKVDNKLTPKMYEVSLSTHRDKLFRTFPKQSIVNKFYRLKIYHLILCNFCLEKSADALQSNYSAIMKDILLDKNWNQTSLAVRLRTSQSVISRIKDGEIEFLRLSVARNMHLVALCQLSDKKIKSKYSYTYHRYSAAFQTLRMYGYDIDKYIFKYQIDYSHSYIHARRDLYDLRNKLKLDLLIRNATYRCNIGCVFSPSSSGFLYLENIKELKRSELSHICIFERSGEFRCFQLYPFIETDLPFAEGHLKTRSLRDKNNYQSFDKELSKRLDAYDSKVFDSANYTKFYTEFFDASNDRLNHTFDTSTSDYVYRLYNQHESKQHKIKT
jgi:DNA-binding Xre family transcriptional regulator